MDKDSGYIKDKETTKNDIPAKDSNNTKQNIKPAAILPNEKKKNLLTDTLIN